MRGIDGKTIEGSKFYERGVMSLQEVERRRQSIENEITERVTKTRTIQCNRSVTIQ